MVIYDWYIYIYIYTYILDIYTYIYAYNNNSMSCGYTRCYLYNFSNHSNLYSPLHITIIIECYGLEAHYRLSRELGCSYWLSQCIMIYRGWFCVHRLMNMNDKWIYNTTMS